MKLDTDDVEFIDLDEKDEEMFDKVVEHLIDEEVSLPERDKSNDSPRKKQEEEKKRVDMLMHSEVMMVQEAKAQHNAYELRKRAKKVGLDLLPPGRHSKTV